MQEDSIEDRPIGGLFSCLRSENAVIYIAFFKENDQLFLF